MTFRPKKQQDSISELFAQACEDLGINTDRCHEGEVTYDSTTGQFTMLQRSRNAKLFTLSITVVSAEPVSLPPREQPVRQ